MNDEPRQTGRLDRRSLLRAGSAGFLGFVGVSGTGVAGASETVEERERSVRIAQSIAPEGLDPIVQDDRASAQIATHVFEGLYVYDDGAGLLPRLATGEPEIENDGERWIVEVDADASFQNGAPVTAEDVTYSLLAPAEEETDNFTQVDMIESAEAIDERTAQFDIDPVQGSFRHTLERKVVPKSYREADKERFDTQAPVGSGPYEFVDWSQGEFAALERDDDYWGGLDPLVQTLRFDVIGSDLTRMQSVREGEVDAADRVPVDDYSTIRDDPNVAIEGTRANITNYLAYNCNDGPTTDPDVRAGIEHAFSTQEFVDDELGPLGTRPTTPVSAPILDEWELPREEYDARINAYDPEAAVDLLSGAVPENWSPRIIVPPVSLRESLCEHVAEGLRGLSEYGLELDPTVDQLGWSEFLQTYTSGNAEDYTMYALGWQSTVLDPDAYLWPLVHVTNAGVTQGHYYGSDGDEFHSTIRDARESTDREERTSMYDDVLRELLDETVFTPAYSLDNSLVYRSELEPPAAHPQDGVHLRTVSEQGRVSGPGLYVDENGNVSTSAFRAAVDDWREGRIDANLLSDLLDAW